MTTGLYSFTIIMLFFPPLSLFTDKTLIASPQWKEHQVLLMETPVHSALLTMRKLGSIS